MTLAICTRLNSLFHPSVASTVIVFIAEDLNSLNKLQMDQMMANTSHVFLCTP